MRKFLVLLLLSAAVAFSGCATVAGTVSGAPTGLVDAPAETYRHNQDKFDEHPILHGLNVIVMAPVGAVSGPVLGFFKGVSLDVQCAIGRQNYRNVFLSYDRASIWRPWTITWDTERR